MNHQTGLMDDILKQISELVPPHQKIYLVGGAVRDSLLKRPIYDWDFIMEGNVIQTAKKIANHLQGSFYLLDAGRNIARVILKKDGLNRVFDFAPFQGKTLIEDLSRRDFSINAMAVDMGAPETIIDFLGGRQALAESRLTACSPSSFTDDPVRILRVKRLSLGLGFSIDPETLVLMTGAVPLIRQVSAERKRDELFRIFNMGQSKETLQWMEQNGIGDILFPELGLMKGIQQSPPHVSNLHQHTLETIETLDQIINSIFKDQAPFTAGAVRYLRLSFEPVQKFAHRLKALLEKEISPGRTRRGLLIFSALLHDYGKIYTQKLDENGRIRFFGHEQRGALEAERIAGDWVLSRAENDYVRTIVNQHMRIHAIAGLAKKPDKRFIHRFFRDAGDYGLDICLLSLADTLATWGKEIPAEVWNKETAVCELLLSSWYEKKEEIITPPRLLSGNDLMTLLDIPPGPLVGTLTANLQEEQAEGRVLTVEDAVNYIKETYRDHLEGDRNDRIPSN